MEKLMLDRTRVLRGGGTFLLLAVLSQGAAAQDLPPAGDLIDSYVQALGGRDAYLAQGSSHMKGSFSVPAAGMTGGLEVFSSEDEKMLTIITIPGMGESRTGYDGEVAWSIDPVMGPRILEGMEFEALRDQARPGATLRDPEYFDVRETVELTEVGGEACYKVRLVWKSGRESFDCYSTESGLLVGNMMTQETPMGSIEVTTVIGDYREFGGIMAPTSMRQQLMGQEQIMSVDVIEFGGVDESIFELPEEIQELKGGS
jgi:hypothetical protein